MNAILDIIEYKFNNNIILDEALTHPSVNNGKNSKERGVFSYERLEFLGDTVLNMVVSEMLFNLFPKDNEGYLARKKMSLICGARLAEIAGKIKLGKFIIMANGERLSGGEYNLNNLENALEALIGAIYVDGGLEVARKFIFKHWYPLAEVMLSPPQDSKTMLQEWAQGRALPIPSYEMVEKTGPSHKPLFIVEVRVLSYEPVRAEGNNKRSAEQKAAELMIKKLEKFYKVRKKGIIDNDV